MWHYMNKNLQGVNGAQGKGEGPRAVQVCDPLKKACKGQRIHAQTYQDRDRLVCAWQPLQLCVKVFRPVEKIVLKAVWLIHGQESWVELCGGQDANDCQGYPDLKSFLNVLRL